jgi:hypothetical protein
VAYFTVVSDASAADVAGSMAVLISLPTVATAELTVALDV